MKTSLLLFTMAVWGFVYGQNTTVKNVAGDESIVLPSLDTTFLKRKFILQNTGVLLSPDGKYFTFWISNLPLGDKTLFIQSTQNNWKKDIIGGKSLGFSANSELFVYNKEDSLYFYNISTGKERAVYARNIKLSKEDGDNCIAWKAWKGTDLTLYNLVTGVEQVYKNIGAYLFSENGKALLMIHEKVESGTIELLHLSIGSTTPVKIWEGDKKEQHLENYLFSKEGNSVAFTIQEKKGGELIHSIWYYDISLPKAVVKLTQDEVEIPSDIVLGNVSEISSDGRFIYFLLQKRIAPFRINTAIARVNVWSYRDTILQGVQVDNPDNVLEKKNYWTAFNVNTNKLVRLESDTAFGENIVLVSKKGGFVIIEKNSKGDRFWLKDPVEYWLVSARDGSRTLLPTKGKCKMWFSPDGGYLLFYDNGQDGSYFSYGLVSKKLTNVSVGVGNHQFTFANDFLYPYRADSIGAYCEAVGIAGWLKGCKGVLVYDNFDIWMLYLDGLKDPVNITKGYGYKHKIKFRLTDENIMHKDEINTKESLLLVATNVSNKQNGFFKTKIGSVEDPELLTMGPYTYYTSGIRVNSGYHFNPGMPPIKAAKENIWILQRQTASDAPNFYVTKDFKNLKRLTNFQPHTGYKWVNVELLSWNQNKDIVTKGILYKPVDFDSSKKYPVIVYCYEQCTQWLFEYPTAALTSDGHINIPWFVSQGYLVLTPDIYFKKGEKCKSAFDAIAEGVKCISKLSYVDTTFIGLSSHSAGGQIVYYLLTHCNLFAAGLCGAGVSDRVSSALQLTGGLDKNSGPGTGSSRLISSELASGKSMWDNLSEFLSESSILSADKLQTPLLIFHCKKDDAVPWEQGVEMFIAARRLQKKCWMLEYDEGDHDAGININCIDFTKRVEQFFDFYLKGKGLPVWMGPGIRASEKGIDTGLELIKE